MLFVSQLRVLCAQTIIYFQNESKKRNEKVNMVAVISFFAGGLFEVLFDFNIFPNPILPTPVMTIVLAGTIYVFGMLIVNKKELTFS